jgi:hypothetical protein
MKENESYKRGKLIYNITEFAVRSHIFSDLHCKSKNAESVQHYNKQLLKKVKK